MSNVKIRLAVVAIVLAGTLFWLTPYWAVSGLASAAQAGDVELLSDYVDIARLRESSKAQLMAAAQSELEKSKGEAFAVLGAALGTLMLDKLVDSMVTPEMLLKVLQANLHGLEASRIAVTIRLICDGQAGWVDDSTFRIRLSHDSLMSWRRDGLTWRLTSVNVRPAKS